MQRMFANEMKFAHLALTLIKAIGRCFFIDLNFLHIFIYLSSLKPTFIIQLAMMSEIINMTLKFTECVRS